MTENLFDDLVLKEKLGSITLNLKAQKDISTWQATRFISDLNTSYYKFELINSVANAINEGVKPENIYILDHSLNIHNLYSQMNVITDSKLPLLYTIGLPYSFSPTIHSLNMRYVFRYFRCINEALRKFHQDRNNKKLLPYYFKKANELSLEESINLLKSETLNNIHDLNIYEKIVSEIDKKCEIIRKDFEKDIRLIEKKDNDTEILSNRFLYYFNIIKRPIVIAYDSDFTHGRVLCRNQLNRKEENDTTFNLRSVSHNSPYQFYITAGIAIATFILAEIRNSLKHKKEMQLKDIEIKIAEKKLEKLENDNSDKNISIDHVNIYLNQKNEELKQIEKIKEPIVQRQLSYLQRTVQDRYGKSARQVDLTLLPFDLMA